MTMLLSLMVMSVYSFTYQTEYNYQRSTFGTTSNYISHNNTQSIEYRRIGYTTNYYNGQFNSGVYKSLEYHNRFFNGTYNPTLDIEDNTDFGYYNGSHRKSLPIRYGSETSDDGTVVVNWYIEYYEILGVGYYMLYVDGVYYGDYLGSYGRAKKIAEEAAKNMANEKSHSVPIGDNYIWFMVCIVSIYSLIKANRNKLKHSAY